MKGKERKADIIFINGKIWTADPSMPWASTAAVRDERFCYVGEDDYNKDSFAKALTGQDTEVIDLDGKFAMPSIIDSHMHLTSTARSSWYFVLTKEQVSSVEAMEKALREYVLAHSKEEVPYIYAESCPTELMDESGIKKDFLDRICSDRPMLLCDANFHRSLVNSCMLQLMEIDPSGSDSLNGIKSYEVDENGQLTGIVGERAFEASLDKMYEKIGWQPPSQSDPDLMEPFLNILNQMGVYTVMDGFTEGEETFIGLEKLEKAGKLRLYYEGASLVENRGDLDRAIETLKKWREKYASQHIRIHNLKLFLDGTNEIGTSALLEPFANDPEGNDCGTLGFTEDELYEIFLRANEENLDVQIHLVGDRAFRVALNGAERAKKTAGSGWDCRITLLHCELTDPKDRIRVRPLGIYINITPQWCGGCFGRASIKYLGEERFHNLYSFNTMLEDGAIVGCSSDVVDVEEMRRIDPFLGMQIGATRYDEECGYGGVREPEDQKIPMEDLLRGYTIQGAKAMRIEDSLGSIQAGKIANMIILNQDPLAAPPETIADTKPILAMFDGTIMK